MATKANSCLFCKKKPWDTHELELLNWYSVNMNGRLDTRVCYHHNQKQIERLPYVRNKVQQTVKRRTTPLEDVRKSAFMEHYREMQADQKTSACCIVM